MSQGSRCAAERRSKSPSAQTTVIDMFLTGRWRLVVAVVYFYSARQVNSIFLGTLKKASAAASSGYWLGPPLIRASKKLCSLSFAAAGSRRVGGRSGSQRSTCLRPARAPLSPRALTRARYGGAALGLPSRASSCPCSDQPMALTAECARVLCRCGGEGADAARRAAQPAPNVVPRPAA